MGIAPTPSSILKQKDGEGGEGSRAGGDGGSRCARRHLEPYCRRHEAGVREVQEERGVAGGREGEAKE